MNSSKQKELFAAVRRESPVPPPSNFAALVMSALPASVPRPSSFDLLTALFPRFAAVALLVIALCAATEVCLDRDDAPGELTQTAEQWFFATE